MGVLTIGTGLVKGRKRLSSLFPIEVAQQNLDAGKHQIATLELHALNLEGQRGGLLERWVDQTTLMLARIS